MASDGFAIKVFIIKLASKLKISNRMFNRKLKTKEALQNVCNLFQPTNTPALDFKVWSASPLLVQSI